MINRRALLCFALLIVLFVNSNASAQSDNFESLLIRNVSLIDPSGKSEDKLVNILIRGGKLELVTEDKISGEEAEQVVNANKGFILGKLEMGQAPSFMILSQDPREKFEVLLDTKTYASFAIHDGQVVVNQLGKVEVDSPEDEPVKSGWLAYAPPPLAIPLNYADTSKWNRWDSSYVSGIFVSALLLDRMNWQSQNNISESQLGNLELKDGGEIRGLRFGLVGTINFEKPWIYTIFGATNAFDKGFESDQLDSMSFLDWRVDIPFLKNSVMSIGKQKEPISGERIQSMLNNANQERSAVSDALLPSRNVGIIWNGSNPERYSSWGFGVFNDWLDTDQDFDAGATQYIGRIAWAPLVSADESNLLHLGFGYRYSDAKEGFRFKTEPEFNNSPSFVDTAFGQDTSILPADKFETYNLELAWRRGPLWLASEYTRTDVASPAFGDPTFDGWWVSGSYTLTGEMRQYNKKSNTFGTLPVARSVYQNGKGAWELSARYSQLDLTDGLIEGGDMQVATLGARWWLTPFFGVELNYRYIWNTLDGQEGTASGMNSRVILILE